jgi:hypothetical protein
MQTNACFQTYLRYDIQLLYLILDIEICQAYGVSRICYRNNKIVFSSQIR